MPNEETLYLQRYQEGLSLVAQSDSGILVLSRESEIPTVWAEVPLKEVEDTGIQFAVTLEAFRSGERLGAEEIQELGFRGLSVDPDVVVRLVLNHTVNGDPLLDPAWEADGVEVLHRPTIDSREGKAPWVLARRLPCVEVRTFQRTEEGKWMVTAEAAIGVCDRSASVEGSSVNDRYSTLCRSIPTHPIARPFGIRPVDRASVTEGLKSFRM